MKASIIGLLSGLSFLVALATHSPAAADKAAVLRLQQDLTALGFDPGPADGLWGPKTRRAAQSFGADTGLDLRIQGYADLTAAYWRALDTATTLQLETREQSLPHLSLRMTAADARHLLERAGIGAHPLEIQALLGLSRSQAISRMMAQLDVSSPYLDPPDIRQRRYAHFHSRGDYEAQDRQSFRIARDQEMAEFRRWWIAEMLSTPAPAGERLLLLWHNHFVTAYSSLDEEVDALVGQHLMFRERGAGNLRPLLKAVIRDAAMLNYLDNSSNHRDNPNENLGRELLELFVLGEGHYSEQDVKEVARALTGYDYSRLRGFDYRFKDWAQDKRRKTIFGKGGNFGGDDVIDLLLAREETALYFAETFWAAYVSEFNHDPEQIAAIATRFRDSDYSIPALLRATLSSSGFWDPANRGTLVKSPVDLLIGSIRTSGKLPDTWPSLDAQLAGLGQNLFEAPNVAGWPGGADWLTPARIVQRSEALQDLVQAPAWTPRPAAAPLTDASVIMDDRILRLRYAAEDFEGPPLFSVTAFADPERKQMIWRSPMTPAEGGLDTGRYGRARNGLSLNWQTAEFSLPSDGETPEAFQVTFPNDFCCGPGGSDGGDRNLFIDWVQLGGSVYFARDGEQVTNCPAGGQDPPGSLYCSGRLFLTKATPLQAEAEAAPELEPETEPDPQPGSEMQPAEGSIDGLKAGRVYLDWVDTYNDADSYVGFTLGFEDLRFEDIVVPAMRVEYAAVRQNGRRDLVLQLSEGNCYPDCWNDPWPSAAWKQRGMDLSVVEIKLKDRDDSNAERQYWQLSDQQKRLVAALWAGLPRFLDVAKQGRNWRRREGEARFQAWEPVLADFERQFASTRYARLAPQNPLVVAPGQSSGAGMMMGMMQAALTVQSPILLGLLRDDLDWTRAPEALDLEDPLAALLAGPATALTLEAVPRFADLVREPAYQVK